jgi:hypothetical protein
VRAIGRGSSRRGLAVLVLVLVVSLISLAVVTIGLAGRDDLTLAVLRVESVRSYYAAESAARVTVESITQGTSITEGDVLADLPTATGVAITVDPGAGRYVVEGRSGRAVRRVELLVSP